MKVTGVVGTISALRHLRNELVDRAFSRLARHTGRTLAERLSEARVSRPCFTIAFNTPWVIELQCLSWAQHRMPMDLVVIDNSSRQDARDCHRAICESAQVPYLGLPFNLEWN